MQEYGNIAIVGERELVIGFRLLGVSHTYIAEGAEGVATLRELMDSGKYSLIILSESIRKHMDRKLLDHVENSTVPLIVFIPLPGGEEEESVEKFAKRVLGVDIGR
jgi:V/A-type H+-transporting ATPase subunit F